MARHVGAHVATLLIEGPKASKTVHTWVSCSRCAALAREPFRVVAATAKEAIKLLQEDGRWNDPSVQALVEGVPLPL